MIFEVSWNPTGISGSHPHSVPLRNMIEREKAGKGGFEDVLGSLKFIYLLFQYLNG